MAASSAGLSPRRRFGSCTGGSWRNTYAKSDMLTLLAQPAQRTSAVRRTGSDIASSSLSGGDLQGCDCRLHKRISAELYRIGSRKSCLILGSSDSGPCRVLVEIPCVKGERNHG